MARVTDLQRQLDELKEDQTYYKAQLKSYEDDSLIFDRAEVRDLDFSDFLQIGQLGFQELCIKIPELEEFRSDFFSDDAVNQNRGFLTEDQNRLLDIKIDRLLSILAANFESSSAVKILEWLIRRFEIHHRNVLSCICAFLPHFQSNIFKKLLFLCKDNKILLVKAAKSELQNEHDLSLNQIAKCVFKDLALLRSYLDFSLQIAQSSNAYPKATLFNTQLIVSIIQLSSEQKKGNTNFALIIINHIMRLITFSKDEDTQVSGYMLLSLFISVFEEFEVDINEIERQLMTSVLPENGKFCLISLGLMEKFRPSNTQMPEEILTLLLNREPLVQAFPALINSDHNLSKLFYEIILSIIDSKSDLETKHKAIVSGLLPGVVDEDLKAKLESRLSSSKLVKHSNTKSRSNQYVLKDTQHMSQKIATISHKMDQIRDELESSKNLNSRQFILNIAKVLYCAEYPQLQQLEKLIETLDRSEKDVELAIAGLLSRNSDIVSKSLRVLEKSLATKSLLVYKIAPILMHVAVSESSENKVRAAQIIEEILPQVSSVGTTCETSQGLLFSNNQGTQILSPDLASNFLNDFTKCVKNDKAANRRFTISSVSRKIFDTNPIFKAQKQVKNFQKFLSYCVCSLPFVNFGASLLGLLQSQKIRLDLADREALIGLQYEIDDSEDALLLAECLDHIITSSMKPVSIERWLESIDFQNLRPSTLAKFSEIGQMWHESERLSACQAIITMAQRKTLSSEMLNKVIDSLHLDGKSIGKMLQTFFLEGRSSILKRKQDGGQENIESKLDLLTILLDYARDHQMENLSAAASTLFQILTDLSMSFGRISEDAYTIQLLLETLTTLIEKEDIKRHQNLKKVVRIDVLSKFIKESSNTQIQNGAMMLAASLAVHYPDLVLHGLMPIITLIGSTIYGRDDGSSMRVIDNVLRKILPSIVRSDSKGTSEIEICSIFVSILPNVPHHRQIRVLLGVAEVLGTREFFPIIVLLLLQKASQKQGRRRHPEAKAEQIAQLLDSIKDEDKFICLITISKSLSDTLNDKESTVSPEDAKRQFTIYLRALEKFSDDHAHRLFIDQGLNEEITTFQEQILAFTQKISLPENAEQTLMPLQKFLNTISDERMVGYAVSVLEGSNADIQSQVIRNLNARLDRKLTVKLGSDFLICAAGLLSKAEDDRLLDSLLDFIRRTVRQSGDLEKDTQQFLAKAIIDLKKLANGRSLIQQKSSACLRQLVKVSMLKFLPYLERVMSLSLDNMKRYTLILQNDSISEDASYIDTALREESRLVAEIIKSLPRFIDAYVPDILEIILHARNWQQHMNIISSLEKSIGPRVALEQLLECDISDKQKKLSYLQNFLDVFDKLRTRCIEQKEYVQPRKMTEKMLINMIEVLEDIEEPDHAIVKSLIDTYTRYVLSLSDSTFRLEFLYVRDEVLRTTTGGKWRKLFFFRFFLALQQTLKSLVTGYIALVLDDIEQFLSELDDVSRTVLQCLKVNFENDSSDYWPSSPFLKDLLPIFKDLLNVCITSKDIDLVSETTVALIRKISSEKMQQLFHKTFFDEFNSSEIHYQKNVLRLLCRVVDILGEEYLVNAPQLLPIISNSLESDDPELANDARRLVRKLEDLIGEDIANL